MHTRTRTRRLKGVIPILHAPVLHLHMEGSVARAAERVRLFAEEVARLARLTREPTPPEPEREEEEEEPEVEPQPEREEEAVEELTFDAIFDLQPDAYNNSQIFQYIYGGAPADEVRKGTFGSADTAILAIDHPNHAQLARYNQEWLQLSIGMLMSSDIYSDIYMRRRRDRRFRERTRVDYSDKVSTGTRFRAARQALYEGRYYSAAYAEITEALRENVDLTRIAAIDTTVPYLVFSPYLLCRNEAGQMYPAELMAIDPPTAAQTFDQRGRYNIFDQIPRVQRMSGRQSPSVSGSFLVQKMVYTAHAQMFALRKSRLVGRIANYADIMLVSDTIRTDFYSEVFGLESQRDAENLQQILVIRIFYNEQLAEKMERDIDWYTRTLVEVGSGGLPADSWPLIEPFEVMAETQMWATTRNDGAFLSRPKIFGDSPALSSDEALDARLAVPEEPTRDNTTRYSATPWDFYVRNRFLSADRVLEFARRDAR